MNSNTTKIILSLIIFIGVILGSQQLRAADGIDVKQAHDMAQQGTLLLDVREPEEFSAAHAPNATLIPLGQLGSRLQEISAYKEKPIVVICHSGRRSAKAVQLLQEAGFSKVNNIKGGMMAWVSAGLEVTKKQ